MSEGSIGDWLAGPPQRPRGTAGRDGSDGNRSGGPVDEPAADLPAGGDARWRPDPSQVEESDARDRTRRLWRVAGALWLGVAVAAGGLWVGGGLLPVGADRAGDGAVPGRDAGGDATGDIATDNTAPDDTPATAATGAPTALAGGAPAGRPDTALQPGAASTTPDALGPDARAVLGATAVLAVRLAVTADGTTARYVDLAQVVAVEQVGDLAVVTVAVVLLEGVDDVWDAVRAARYGVALDLASMPPGGQGAADDASTGTPRVLGAPWPLPSAPVALPPRADAAPLDDPALEEPLRAALRAAGYEDPVVLGAVGTARASLLQIRVEARGPEERTRTEHDVWVHLGADIRVLGMPA